MACAADSAVRGTLLLAPGPHRVPVQEATCPPLCLRCLALTSAARCLRSLRWMLSRSRRSFWGTASQKGLTLAMRSWGSPWGSMESCCTVGR